MNPDNVNSSRDVLAAVKYLLAEKTNDEIEIAALEARLEDVEIKQGYLANRPKIAVPRFPVILKRYGILPPERAAT